jgi:cold shock CspA family protein
VAEGNQMQLEGVINAYFASKGYGFINEVRSGKIIRYFLHISQVVSGSPKVGALAKFDFVQTLKGLQAVNITIENSPQSEVRS